MHNDSTALPAVAQEAMPAADMGADISSRIFTIRGVQVMLDRDLAVLYGVETRVLNQAVKRNADRFPAEFTFALSVDEMGELITTCDRFKSMKHSSVLSRAFTEHGIIMLASVLKSDVAAHASIQIARAFVAMRKALASVAPILQRLDIAKRRQITDQSRNEERFDAIFKAMDGGDFPPQKVFFDGKHYEAFSFARKLVREAAKSIILIDRLASKLTAEFGPDYTRSNLRNMRQFYLMFPICHPM